KSLASKIKDYLAAHQETTVSVGRFEGPPGISSNVARIQKALKDELTALKIDTESGGREIRGACEVKVSGEGSARRIEVVIRTKIVTRLGAEDQAFISRFKENNPGAGPADPKLSDDGKTVEQSVATEDDVKTIAPTTTDLTTGVEGIGKPNQTKEVLKQRDAREIESLENPKVSILPSEQKPAADAPAPQSVITARPDSPYRLEILVRKAGPKDAPPAPYAPCPVVNKGGVAEVKLNVGDEYAVRIINKASHDVGVRLLIDSLSMFEFSSVPDYKRLQMVWIGANSEGLIEGWHISNKEVRAFQVASAPESEAFKRQVAPGDVGTIAAMFVASWVGEVPPSVEVLGLSRDELGTVVGRPLPGRFEPKVAHFGQSALATVAVRYKVPDDLPIGETVTP
ncbi:MAG: hypothetical protein IT428_11640, partial [Planctomycetaceae bacterium]|nr:hypothetical protein [Planctomycetaceae bacterium]